FSPVGQQLSLGAAVAPNGTSNFVGDPADDRTVSVAAGTSVVSRPFNLSGLGAGVYTVRWGLWSAGFGTQFGEQDRNGVLTILNTVATSTPPPTAIPTGTLTFTPVPGTPTDTPTFTVTSTPAPGTATYTP